MRRTPAAASKAPKAFKTPAAFRAWLARHHATETELLIRLFKVHARHRGIGYKEALDEALCFGWIDGVVRRLDEDSYVQRFSPRKPRSTWSKVNVAHVERLIREGRMQPPGLAAFQARTPERTGIYSFERPRELSPEYVRRFEQERAAWAWFTTQPPYYRRLMAFWVMEGKREETREKRFARLVESSRKGVRIT